MSLCSGTSKPQCLARLHKGPLETRLGPSLPACSLSLSAAVLSGKPADPLTDSPVFRRVPELGTEEDASGTWGWKSRGTRAALSGHSVPSPPLPGHREGDTERCLTGGHLAGAWWGGDSDARQLMNISLLTNSGSRAFQPLLCPRRGGAGVPSVPVQHKFLTSAITRTSRAPSEAGGVMTVVSV